MIDLWTTSVLKRALAALWLFELRVRRALSRRKDPRRWAITGACGNCGACCEEPSIHVGKFTWYVPMLRTLFLAWQRMVNGLVFVRSDRETHVFVFRCTHFDPTTRRCDSYPSRPGMCRDYPLLMEDHAWPQLLDGCSYQVKALGQEKLRASIDATDLPEEKKAELRRKLRLE